MVSVADEFDILKSLGNGHDGISFFLPAVKKASHFPFKKEAVIKHEAGFLNAIDLRFEWLVRMRIDAFTNEINDLLFGTSRVTSAIIPIVVTIVPSVAIWFFLVQAPARKRIGRSSSLITSGSYPERLGLVKI